MAKGDTFTVGDNAKGKKLDDSNDGGDKGDAFGINGVEGKTVVVGIRMDSQSRELLTWALVKAAVPGDRVVALHVLSGRRGADPGGDPAVMLSLAKDFDAMLSVYEGVCNLKQIDLKLKICKGSSIRKVLVREAVEFGASKLILGVATSNSGIGSSSVSIAKYCAKKLPRTCSVLALKNGKIVFQREAAENNIGHKKPSRESSKVIVDEDGNELYCVLPGRSGQREVALEPLGLQEDKINDFSDLDSKVVVDEDGNELYCILPGRSGQREVGLEPLGLQENEINNFSNLDSDLNDDLAFDDASSTKSCSICSPDIQHPSSNQLKDGHLLASTEAGKSEFPSNSSMPARANWPSLRRFVLITKKSGSSDKSKNGTMQCPVRNSNGVLPLHQDQLSLKYGGNQLGNLDCDSGTVVHVGTDSPQPSSVDNDSGWTLPQELEPLREKYSSICRLFAYDELINAVSNFSPEMLIGTGGSSRVYKGCLPNGKELAVKILKASEETVEEFLSEIEILTTLEHKNIISLGGFCIDNNNLILVFDYLPRGSLEEILHGEKEIKHVLSWSERYKVALGVAEALSYLHGGGSAESVIHRDVKSSNILLSDDFEPQLSDFGLAKWASKCGSQLTPNDVAGTFGYLAPEYFLYGKVNEKVDVYAFGVVLLELLSGRKPIFTGPNGKENLVMWAKPILLAGELKQIIDPCLGNDYDASQAERIMLSASLCTRRLNQARPQISTVLKLLRGDEDVIDWARLEVNTVKPPDCLEGVANSEYDIRSHLSLALLDVEDDTLSNSSTDCTTGSLSTKASVEDYMHWRSSRSSSFD